jgi:hypothetical protein
MIRRLLREIAGLSWTIGGTGLVLITMSGGTLRQGIWISAAALFMHTVGVIVDLTEKHDVE